ncbi:hypothetical protein HDR66_00710 [bacterium]|nr:hypothetical protein [bacterium]
MFKILMLISLVLMPTFAHADDDCIDYKLTPRVIISSPSWTKEVVQPIHQMDLLHGDVIATLVDNYDITADTTDIEGGICVALKSVDALVGYEHFLVQIDIRHAPNTCTYDAILSHEDEHIRAYLGIIDEYGDDLHSAIMAAADSVMPIFVEDRADVDAAVDKLNSALQSHPDVILIKQKIKAAEEIRNKRVDALDNGTRIKQCMK